MLGYGLNRAALAFVLAFVPAFAVGTEVYRWVDDEGVVHFSQTRPMAPDTEVEALSIEDDRPSDYDPEADIYGVAEQAERMQALREEMAAKRADALERNRRQPSPVIVRSEPEYVGFPVYRRPWLRPPWPQPRPPIARPPGAGDWIRPPRPITPPSSLEPPIEP
jgi:hypothetical protein